MTPSQRLYRQRLAAQRELSNLESKANRTPDEEARLNELAGNMASLDAQYRRLVREEEIALGAPPTAEESELGRLSARADLGRILHAVATHRPTEGAEAELQQALGLGGHSFPVEMLRSPVNVVTPAPATGVAVVQREPLPGIFPRAISAWLGVSMPVVEVGEAAFPVVATNTVAADYDEGDAVTEPAGSIEGNSLQPRRISASYRYSREDAAKLVGLDPALRRNLSAAISSGIDNYTLNKTDLGLLQFGDDPTDPTDAETFASYRQDVFSAIEGAHASMATDLRVLLGPATYAHAASVYNSDGDESALKTLMDEGVGVMTTKHVPDADSTSNVQQAVIAVGMDDNAVCPVWREIQVVFDEVTSVAKGEIVLTAVALMQFKVLRASGYKRTSFKLA